HDEDRHRFVVHVQVVVGLSPAAAAVQEFADELLGRLGAKMVPACCRHCVGLSSGAGVARDGHCQCYWSQARPRLPRLRPPPSPPGERASASLTVRVRPPIGAPLRAWMAASPPSPISTKPKPRLRPVSWSVTTCARCTVPCERNAASRSPAVASNGRFP